MGKPILGFQYAIEGDELEKTVLPRHMTNQTMDRDEISSDDDGEPCKQRERKRPGSDTCLISTVSCEA